MEEEWGELGAERGPFASSADGLVFADADGFEPQEIKVKASTQWDDEDLDDDVKVKFGAPHPPFRAGFHFFGLQESWEDDEEEKKDTEKQEAKLPAAGPPKKSKKNLSKKIEEKEVTKKHAFCG
jgi:Translation initiation factor eIF3 subunit